MKIKFRSQIRNRIVNMLVETGDFTDEENKILNQVGEPVLVMDKMYGPNTVKIEKKIRSGFRVSVKFDGNLSESMDDVMLYIDEFIDDLKIKANEVMIKSALDYSKRLSVFEEEGKEHEISTITPLF